ncbi:MAG: acyl-CoA dehydrogenase, partial [Syntrophomonas sp.]|nr:acyl-CoA dehydrogenase [Syntrophomonas sp.]
WWLCGEAIQDYGGYGYCEEYPVAQMARDIKIYSIWEGTNYIQALDLVGRKMTMKKGSVFAAFIEEIADFCAAPRSEGQFTREFANLEKALTAYRQIQKTLLNLARNQQMNLVAVYARRILTATAQLYGAYLILDQACLAQRRLGELQADHYDRAFYQGKVEAARYYLLNVVPNVWLTAELLASEDTSVVDIPSESFNY